jgi:hypothetical protein
MPVSGYATDNYSCYFSPAARYDMYRYIVNLSAGNYQFRIMYGYAGDRDQMSLYVDNTYITWFEGYGTGNTNAKSTSSDFNIPNTGTHKVELRIDAKHPSSTDYYFLFQCASIFKTS